MREQVVNFLNNINLGYLSLVITLFIVSFIFLHNKGINKFFMELFIIVYVLISWIGFYYLNDIFNLVFDLKYLDVKLYLILLIIGNIIMIANINLKLPIYYKVINYAMFLTNIVMFVANITLIIASKVGAIEISSLANITKFININFIVFVCYLNLLGIVYIGKYLSRKMQFKIKAKEIFEQESLKKDAATDSSVIDDVSVVETNSHVITNDVSNNVSNDLSSKEGFFIDGIDCSAIFDDTDKENIARNYYILLNDVNAKLTNGYTVKEYTKIKNIINKLNIKDLNNVNLDINVLNHITIDEYNILKSYLNKRGINI